MLKKVDINSVAIAMLAVFGVVLSTVIVLYAFMAAPVADDWVYYSYYTQGFSDYINAAMGHTGRLLQWVLVFVGFKLFGMALAVKIVPILLYITYIASVWWFLFVTKILNKSWHINLIIAVLVCGVSLFLMPSIFDTYMWLTSSTVYLASMVTLFVSTTLIYILLTKKLHWGLILLILLVVALGQTLSEPTSALLIGGTGLALVGSLIYKKWSYVYRLSATLVALIAGFLIVYLSPGSVSRRETGIKADWHNVFVESFDGYGLLFQDWRLWALLIPIIFLATLALSGSKGKKVSPMWYLIISMGSFIFFTYPIFALNNYTQNYMPVRIMSLPTLGVVLSVVFLAIFVANKLNIGRRGRVVALLGGVIMVAVALPTVLRVSSKNLSILSIRYSISSYRDASVDDQISKGVTPVVIERAPVFLRSDAADFYYSDGQWDKNGRNWVANSYLKYKGLSEELPQDAVTLIDPPAFYTWR